MSDKELFETKKIKAVTKNCDRVIRSVPSKTLDASPQEIRCGGYAHLEPSFDPRYLVGTCKKCGWTITDNPDARR